MGRDSKYCNKNTISIENLRKKVSPVSLEDYFILRYYKDNVKVWSSMLENEKKNRYMPGLVTMHVSKRTKKRKVK